MARLAQVRMGGLSVMDILAWVTASAFVGMAVIYRPPVFIARGSGRRNLSLSRSNTLAFHPHSHPYLAPAGKKLVTQALAL